MLGVRRLPPAFSLDELELERSALASKIQNIQTLSIYEATLEKLRSGSRRAFKEIERSKEGSLEREGSGKSMAVDEDGNLVKLGPEPLRGFKENMAPAERPSEMDGTRKPMEVDKGTKIIDILLKDRIDCTHKK